MTAILPCVAITPMKAEAVPDDVAMWRLDLDLHARLPDSVLLSLDEAENARLRRYARHEDKVRFAITRAALKQLLAQAASCDDPARVSFAYTDRGRPQWPVSGLRFNVSHSGAMACIAISRRRDVGIDVEATRDPDIDIDALACIVLADVERDAWERLPAAQRRDAFYRHWVCKEAALKTTGHGIADLLRHIAVRPCACGGALHRIECDMHRLEGASLRDLTLCVLTLSAGYAGAVAWGPEYAVAGARAG
jgi:4'-phosphopantetheinyl transferase